MDGSPQAHPEVAALLARSRRLGADRRVTNYGGGNTSAKVVLDDPVSGVPVEVLAVKGSGGDLGTLTAPGLALLDLTRVRALERIRAAGTAEDDLVALYAHCRFGDGGAAPSIDTPLHALVDAHHVDHLHPDAVIALAAAARRRTARRRVLRRDVGWLPLAAPWVRPRTRAARPPLAAPGAARRGARRSRHHLVGRGRVTRARPTRSTCLPVRSASSPNTAAMSRSVERLRHGVRCRSRPATPRRFGWRPSCAGSRRPTGRWSVTSPTRPWCSTSWSGKLRRDSRRSGRRAPITSCARRSAPLVLDLDPTSSFDSRVARLRALHAEYRAGYARYYDAHAEPESPPMRGGDPADRARPRRRDVELRHRRRRRHASPASSSSMRSMSCAAPKSVSTYMPIPDSEKFRGRVLGARGTQAPRTAAAPRRWPGGLHS